MCDSISNMRVYLPEMKIVHWFCLFSITIFAVGLNASNGVPQPQFSRQDSIKQQSSKYWDSVFHQAYLNAFKFTDTNGNVSFIPWEIRSRFFLKFETGFISNSLFERFVGGNDQPFFAVKITRNDLCCDSFTNNPDSVTSIDVSRFKQGQVFENNLVDSNQLPLQQLTLKDSGISLTMTTLKRNAGFSTGETITTKKENAIKTSPKTTNNLRVLIKFDWMGDDTLRNILLLSDADDLKLDLGTVLNYWVGGIPQIKNVQVNRNDTFLPKRDLNNHVEDFGHDVFLPEFYIKPLTCFHAPLVVEYWAKDKVVVYRDMEKMEGLTLEEVLPILRASKLHMEMHHDVQCKNEMLKLRLFINNKNAMVSDFIPFVDGLTEINYLLEVKTNW